MTEIIHVKAPGGPDALVPATIELPPPAPGEIRLRQSAIGVNFIDVYQRMGLYPLQPAGIPGVEAVGTVVAAGDGVDGVEIGDRVAYAGAPVGAYASERNLPAWRAVRLPDGIDDATVASTFVKGITAEMLLSRVYPVAADTLVLVHSAAGGLGRLLTRWAVARGATVVGTVGSPAKAEVAREAGAEHVIVGRDADFAAELTAWSGGRKADVAYDGVGGTTLRRTLDCVRPFGVVASIGQSGGPIPPLDVDEIGPRRCLMLARPSVMAFMNTAEDYHRAAAAVLGAVASGLFGEAGRPYPLAEASRAHADLEMGITSGSLYLVP